jgi:hypothetical protein
MRVLVLILLTTAGLVFRGSLCAAEAPTIVDPDITLRDLDGVERQPLRGEKRRPSVLLFVTHDCPISNGYAPEYQRLWREYLEAKIPMYLVYVDPDATTGDLAKHQREFKLSKYPAIHDAKHRLVAATGAEMTPEAVIVGIDGRIEYRGRVDNLYADYGKRRRAATVRDLRDALDALLSGKPVKKPRTRAIGCFIPPLPEN